MHFGGRGNHGAISRSGIRNKLPGFKLTTERLDGVVRPFEHEPTLGPSESGEHESREQNQPLSLLAQAAVAIDRSRSTARSRDYGGALEAWTALVAGRWSLVECFVNEGRRFLVVRRNDPPGSFALTRRERQVVAYRARGYSLKLIAYELGLTASTISTHMASARTKLGFRSNVNLVATLSLNSDLVQHELGEKRLEIPAPLGLRKSTLLHAGTELWVLSFLVSDFDVPECLSKAERHVLGLLLNGESTAQIAAQRQTSLYTVCNQVASIYRKVRVGSRVELVTKLRRTGTQRSEHVRHEAHQRQPLEERRGVPELDVLEQG